MEERAGLWTVKNPLRRGVTCRQEERRCVLFYSVCHKHPWSLKENFKYWTFVVFVFIKNTLRYKTTFFKGMKMQTPGDNSFLPSSLMASDESTGPYRPEVALWCQVIKKFHDDVKVIMKNCHAGITKGTYDNQQTWFFEERVKFINYVYSKDFKEVCLKANVCDLRLQRKFLEDLQFRN